ncbi:MAG: helix-turn-helix transcriptional regulator [Solirubrobacterales bacterium]|nr:helix-turn-helix transcriptional regulator [Solirubrobacterales bacterium]
MDGDADIAKVGALVADPARARILLALGDGRALPASVLAGEAGVAPSTASVHLAKLVDGGMLNVERHGRHRYFRVAGEPVAALLEALARLSPPAPVRSLRAGTKASAVRFARTCYDHLAGVLGTELMAALLDRALLTGGDGVFARDSAVGDRLAAPGFDLDYRLTERGVAELGEFGIDFAGLRERRRPLIRYCVDWSEQRHHLGGALGAALAERIFERGWVSRARDSRAVRVTDEGRQGLRERFGLELEQLAS